MTEVILTKWGVANCIDSQIEVNEVFVDTPFFDELVTHELAHRNKEQGIDWRVPWSSALFFFILRHPRTWVQYSPVWIRGRRVLFDKTLLLFWAFIIFYTAFLTLAGLWIRGAG